MLPARSLLLGLAVCFAPASAWAQSDATAETLFREGKRLLAEKRYDLACPKFAESARIAPSSGVGLALGLCYEAQGKTASAWGAYTAVIGLARRDARADREKVASAHAKALEASLAHVTFAVDPATAALEGLELRQDGNVLGPAAWSEIPVDPGAHRVEVRAPGHDPFVTGFTVGDGAAQQTVTVPPLKVAATAGLAGSTAVASRPPDPDFPWSTAGLVAGGVGVGSIVVGSILGGLALGKVNDAQRSCPTSTCANASAVSENASGATFADASTGLFVTGGVLVAAGAAAFFLAPRRSPHGVGSWRIVPVVGPGYGGLKGAF